MTWVRSAQPHLCDLPQGEDLAGHRTGDRWRCDICGALWALLLDGKFVLLRAPSSRPCTANALDWPTAEICPDWHHGLLHPSRSAS